MSFLVGFEKRAFNRAQLGAALGSITGGSAGGYLSHGSSAGRHQRLLESSYKHKAKEEGWKPNTAKYKEQKEVFMKKHAPTLGQRITWAAPGAILGGAAGGGIGYWGGSKFMPKAKKVKETLADKVIKG